MVNGGLGIIMDKDINRGHIKMVKKMAIGSGGLMMVRKNMRATT